MKKIIIVSFILAVACHRVFAAEDSVSQQVQQLNTQIQAQLQAIQADQQKQIQALNKQVEAQFKAMQTDLQAQIQKVNTKTQEQINQLQKSLVKQESTGSKQMAPPRE